MGRTWSEEDALLDAWVVKQDRQALEELLRRCAARVFFTGFRMTGNRTDAEDIAQQCMADFVREAATIRGDLGLWLHARAASRAQNVLRESAARRKHEMIVATLNGAMTDDDQWKQVSPAIDAAIDRLPQELRAPIVLCYVDGHSQSDIAAELGVDQATVSRRLDKGVSHLRRELKRAGVAVPLALLLLFLGERMTAASPASLIAAAEQIAQNAVCDGAGAAVSSGAAAETVEVASQVVSGADTAAAGFASWKVALVGLAGLALMGGIVGWLGFTRHARPAAPSRNEPASAVVSESHTRFTPAPEAPRGPDVNPQHDGGAVQANRAAEPPKQQGASKKPTAVRNPPAGIEMADGQADRFAADPSFIQADRREPPPRAEKRGSN